MASKLKRRVIAAPVGISMGSLLADEDKARAEADRAAAKAQAEEDKKTSQRANQAKIIISDYTNGNTTYTDANNQLTAMLAAEKDPELTSILKSYIDSALNTRDTRELNDKTDQYNQGALSYDEYTRYLSNIKSQNDVIKTQVAKNLTAARQTENGRLLTKWFNDYQAGNLDINQYQVNLAQLRDKAGQSPADMDKITQQIQAARDEESARQDQKAYADWQSGAISATAAMAYFNSRIANERNPQIQANVQKMLSSIKSSADSSAKGGASARIAEIDKNASGIMDDFIKNELTPAIKACDGDATCIQDAFSAYGKVADQLSQMGGSLSPQWSFERDQASTKGAIVAANEQFLHYDKQIKKAFAEIGTGTVTQSEDGTSASTTENKGLTDEQKAARLRKIAGIAADAEASPFMTDAQKQAFTNYRGQAATMVNDLVQATLAKRQQATTEMTSDIAKMYADIMGARSGDGGMSRALAAFKGTGLTFDGSAEDQNRFANWIANNPATNVARATEFAGTTYNAQGQANVPGASTKSIDQIVQDIQVAGQGETPVKNLITTQLHIQFPRLDDNTINYGAELRLANIKGITETGAGIQASYKMSTAMADLQDEMMRTQRIHSVFDTPSVGMDSNGNYIDPGSYDRTGSDIQGWLQSMPDQIATGNPNEGGGGMGPSYPSFMPPEGRQTQVATPPQVPTDYTNNQRAQDLGYSTPSTIYSSSDQEIPGTPQFSSVANADIPSWNMSQFQTPTFNMPNFEMPDAGGGITSGPTFDAGYFTPEEQQNAASSTFGHGNQ